MVQDNEDKSQSAYDRLSEINPPKSDAKIELDSEISPITETGGSLTNRMKLSPKKTDIQVVMDVLFPEIEIPWLKNLMVARIFPETFNPLRNIIAKHLLQEYPEMSVAQALSVAELVLTVPLDGEGRLDAIHISSKLKEIEDEKDKNKLV